VSVSENSTIQNSREAEMAPISRKIEQLAREVYDIEREFSNARFQEVIGRVSDTLTENFHESDQLIYLIKKLIKLARENGNLKTEINPLSGADIQFERIIQHSVTLSGWQVVLQVKYS
jgi:hypothetical protein